ncbi:MAG: 3-deoxy-manno-octulosonate cytidylyltransferase [Candidatus Eisenbacteria bacterium]|nr:3-deoxy-manno-octulosonate cytidylyltransferase [Candidatus Eisenbacteria bacterium]
MEASSARVIGVIPARYGSTRFPGKVLARWRGRTILEHVYRRAAAVPELDEVWIAVDDDRVYDAARSLGAKVRRTSPDHPSGTDRVGELAASLDPPPAGVVNIQGDEPLVDPRALSALAAALRSDPAEIVTLAHPMEDRQEAERTSVVKVVVDPGGRALYFSRSLIPHDTAGWRGTTAVLRHVGLYGFRRDALARFTAAPPSRLEQAEGLEQLRALELGWTIRVLVGPWRSCAVDTPEDLARLDDWDGGPGTIEETRRANQ